MKKTLKKRIKALILCATFLSSLMISSCQSVKLYFAGELTDQGISMDSVACGSVYVPESSESALSPIPYDTVFEDCLFVGNKVMCDFNTSLNMWRKNSSELLKDSVFFCGENFSVYENNYGSPETPSSSFPTVTVEKALLTSEDEGEKTITYKCTVEEAVEVLGIKRVVICLAGINDLPIYGDEANCHTKTASEMAKLVKSLKNKVDGISIAVLSVPPISAEATYMKSVNNEKIKELNEALKSSCTSNGADYIDMWSLLVDSNGALKKEYCSDGYSKLNEEGCKVMLSSIRYYAQKRKGEI